MDNLRKIMIYLQKWIPIVKYNLDHKNLKRKFIDQVEKNQYGMILLHFKFSITPN